MTLETTEEMATPAAPMWKAYTRMAFPQMFIKFITREAIMETLEFPMERNMEAQAL